MSESDSGAGEILVPTAHGAFYAPRGDLITDQLQRFGAHTRNELAMTLDHIRPGDVVIDIGAHIGTFAIPIARKLGAHGRVLAVEADPRLFETLKRNVDRNELRGQIDVLCAIFGQANAPALRRVEVMSNSGAGHFAAARNGEGMRAVDALQAVEAFGYSAPNFIKIDIEGMELFVLRSLAPLLRRCRPRLYLEMVADQLARHGAGVDDVEALLRPLDYRFYRNVGERNSGHDRYEMKELSRLTEGGAFFDLLALPA